jgi:hypothetical protein
MIGVAQEKISTFRTEKRRNPQTGASYPWIVRASAVVNQYYCYGLDVDFGPFFVKFSSSFPYGAKLCFNGHHWAQRQAQAAGIAFTALDNGFLDCDQPQRLQRICDRRSDRKIDAFFRRWLARLPHPFTGSDRRAGYRYQLSILQAEFSLTQVLDRPHSGRVFFESLIRENLDLGRPDKVSVIFDRRVRGRHPTPSRWRTRVLTDGVTPSIHVDSKHSKIKQYHKLQKAIRTETTINDTRDFAIGKRLGNLPALREVGFHANRRLLATQRLGHDPITAAQALHQITDPITIPDSNTTVAGLRFGDPRAMALLSLLPVFRLSVRGFTNRELRTLLAPLLGLLPGTITAGQATYDLRRLRVHGLIKPIPHSNRHLPTEDGLRAALVLTQTHNRILTPAIAAANDPLTALPDLHRAINNVKTTIDRYATQHGLAA